MPKTLAPVANETSVTEVSHVPMVDPNADVTNSPDTPELPPVKFDDLDKIAEGLEVSLPKKEPEATTEATTEKEIEAEVAKEEPKEEPVVAEPKVEEPKAEEPVTKPVQKGRDYSGLTDDERKMFNNVGAKAYPILRATFDENKRIKSELTAKEKQVVDLSSGKTVLPDSYYEHPDAYVLHPEYGTKVQTVNIAKGIEAHWVEQLEKVSADDDWQPLLQNEKGEFVLGEKQPATPQAKAQLIQQVQYASQQRERVENDARKFVDGFKDRVKQTQSFIKQGIEDKFFGWLNDENLKKPENARAASIIKAATESLPPELKNNPLAPALIKAFTASVMLSEQIRKQSSATQTATLKKEDATKTQPTAASISAGAGQLPNTKKVDMNFFERAMDD